MHIKKLHQLVQLSYLLVFFCLTVISCGASSVPSSSTANHPQATPNPQPCTGRNVVLLFFHHPGQRDGVRCVEAQTIPPNQLGTESQTVLPPATQVYKICTDREEVFVEYALYEDPTAQSLPEGAIGSIYLDVQAQTCQAIQAAVNEESMMVTSVWFAPFFGGKGFDTDVSRIHQVGAAVCAIRTDFFRVWYDGGKRQACFADAGILKLARPLAGVTKVCSGNNTGIASFDQGGVTGISLELTKRSTCATTAVLVHESSVTIPTIDILPASSAA